MASSNSESGGPKIRISDNDRDEAILRLNAASGDGRITLDEFSERSRHAYRAQYQHEIDALFHDLPAATRRRPAQAKGLTTGKRKWLVHIAGASNPTGTWNPGDTITAISILSTQSIDLSHVDADHVSITAFGLFGKVEITVKPGTVVDVSGFSILGGIKDKLTHQSPGGNTVAVRAWGVLGRCVIRNPPQRAPRLAPPPPLQPPPPELPR